MIYLTGDTHGEVGINKLVNGNNPLTKTLTKDDKLIILGDFGLFWNVPRSDTEKYWLDWLSNQEYQVLFLDGNHENFDLLEQFEEVEMFGGKVGVAYDNIYHLKRGEVYTIEDNKILVVGGASSIDRVYRTLNKSWWEAEELSLAEIKNTEDNIVSESHKFDYVLTHTIPGSMKRFFGFYNGLFCSTSEYFSSIYRIISFKHWYTGHMHMDKTVDNVTILYDKIIKLGDTIPGDELE